MKHTLNLATFLVLLAACCLTAACSGRQVKAERQEAAPSASLQHAPRPPLQFASLSGGQLAPKGLFVGRTPKRKVQSLLVAGDSLSISLGEQLEASVGQASALRFGRLGKVSSGLARPDFFDWDAALATMTERLKPDVAVIMIGANDNKPLRTPSGAQSQAAFGSPEWDAGYAARVQRVINICRRANPQSLIVWMSAPVMSDKALSRDLEHVNAVIARVLAANRDCCFVDTWEVFAGPDREFVMHKPDLSGGMNLRARDGVHLTSAGAQALAERCLSALESRVQLPRPVNQATQAWPSPGEV